MKRPILLVALALVFVPASASAQLVTYEFTAVLDSDGVTGTPNAGSLNEFLLDNSIVTLTGTYSYDIASPLVSSSSFTGNYDTGELSFDQFADVPLGFGFLTVFNDAGLPGQDAISDVQWYPAGQSVSLVLVDKDATLYGDLSLPLLLDLSDFEGAWIEFTTVVGEGEFETVSSSANFDITEFRLIPEPASATLLLLGALALGLYRRRMASFASPTRQCSARR